MSTELMNTVPEFSAIEKSKAESIKKTFEPMVQMLEAFESKYNEVVEFAKNGIDKKVTSMAKETRIAISKVRIEAEKARKSEKEEYLRAGKAIDGACNILKWAVEEKEEKLKQIENYFEELERQRKEKLQSERVELLKEWVEDAHERDLASMEEDVFNAFLATKKQAKLDLIEAEKQAKIKAEKEAEELRKAQEAKRLAEIEEAKKEAERLAEIRRIEMEKQHKIDLENARIKAEKEAESKKEAERLEVERIAKQKEANIAHVSKILKEAKESIMALGFSEDDAKKIVIAIKDNKILNTKIIY